MFSKHAKKYFFSLAKLKALLLINVTHIMQKSKNEFISLTDLRINFLKYIQFSTEQQPKAELNLISWR